MSFPDGKKIQKSLQAKVCGWRPEQGSGGHQEWHEQEEGSQNIQYRKDNNNWPCLREEGVGEEDWETFFFPKAVEEKIVRKVLSAAEESFTFTKLLLLLSTVGRFDRSSDLSTPFGKGGGRKEQHQQQHIQHQQQQPWQQQQQLQHHQQQHIQH